MAFDYRSLKTLWGTLRSVASDNLASPVKRMETMLLYPPEYFKPATQPGLRKDWMLRTGTFLACNSLLVWKQKPAESL